MSPQSDNVIVSPSENVTLHNRGIVLLKMRKGYLSPSLPIRIA